MSIISEERGSEIYHTIANKLTTYVSYWYYSAGAVLAGFERLQEDIDNGEV